MAQVKTTTLMYAIRPCVPDPSWSFREKTAELFPEASDIQLAVGISSSELGRLRDRETHPVHPLLVEPNSETNLSLRWFLERYDGRFWGDFGPIFTWKISGFSFFKTWGVLVIRIFWLPHHALRMTMRNMILRLGDSSEASWCWLLIWVGGAFLNTIFHWRTSWSWRIDRVERFSSSTMRHRWPVVATQTFFYFHPEPWGNDANWRAYFFQMGGSTTR